MSIIRKVPVLCNNGETKQIHTTKWCCLPQRCQVDLRSTWMQHSFYLYQLRNIPSHCKIRNKMMCSRRSYHTIRFLKWTVWQNGVVMLTKAVHDVKKKIIWRIHSLKMHGHKSQTQQGHQFLDKHRTTNLETRQDRTKQYNVWQNRTIHNKTGQYGTVDKTEQTRSRTGQNWSKHQ